MSKSSQAILTAFETMYAAGGRRGSHYDAEVRRGALVRLLCQGLTGHEWAREIDATIARNGGES